MNRQPGTIWGYGDEFVSGPRLDDLQCAFVSLEAFLQAENEKLSQQSGIDSGAVKLVYIYSTSTRGRVAEVLGGGLGLREVQVGDHLYDGYTVQEIGKDYIRAVSNDGKENLLKLLFLGQE